MPYGRYNRRNYSGYSNRNSYRRRTGTNYVSAHDMNCKKCGQRYRTTLPRSGRGLYCPNCRVYNR